MASKWKKLKFAALSFSKPKRVAKTSETQEFSVSFFTVNRINLVFVLCHVFQFFLATFIVSLNSVCLCRGVIYWCVLR